MKRPSVRGVLSLAALRIMTALGARANRNAVLRRAHVQKRSAPEGAGDETGSRPCGSRNTRRWPPRAATCTHGPPTAQPGILACDASDGARARLRTDEKQTEDHPWRCSCSPLRTAAEQRETASTERLY